MNEVDNFNKYYYSTNLKYENNPDFNGLTRQQLLKLSDGKRFEKEDLIELMDEIEHGILIGYNVNYERKVIDSLCIRHGLDIRPTYLLDTIAQYSGGGKYKSLEWVINNIMDGETAFELMSEFEEKGKSFHDAEFDVEVLYRLIKNDPDFVYRYKNFLKTVPRREWI